MDIYDRIKDITMQKGINIATMEKDLGFSQGNLGRMMKNNPKISKLQQVADYLGVTVSMLLGENNDYYFDQETAEMADSLFNDKEMRMLFSAARGSSPEDLKNISNILLSLKRKEQYNGEDPS